ncbi:hypothetical protein HDU97_000966 [Phlyctochytrium planicorne]|nr:hypothetical protein HDU97_000966 [Phlyctochytrium planicorne]
MGDLKEQPSNPTEPTNLSDTIIGDENTAPWLILKSTSPILPSYRLTKTAATTHADSDTTSNPSQELTSADRSSSSSSMNGFSASTGTPKGGAMGEGYLIGRGKECDIVVNQQHLSKRHCLIFKESRLNNNGAAEDCVFIQDMSTNGTYVNGTRMTGGKQVQLRNGDEIQLAKYDPKRKMEKFDDRFWIVQIPQSNATSTNGDSIHDQFLITGELGTGNFATVKIGTQRSTGKKYAIKILDKKRFEKKPKMVESIRREITLLMAVNHPCIINIGGVYDEKDFIYIVLELARGGELFDLIIDKKKFTENECRVVMKQLLTALKYLHDRNIVHRDLKPENILLVSRDDGDLRIKISDFGLAKLVGEESFLKTLCGTPNYVAPEVLNPAQGRAYGKSVDLWSSGVIFYICLCGFPPFSEELAPPSMSEQIKTGRYNFPSPFWDKISPQAVDLCKKLMTVNPDVRLTAEQALEHEWMKMDPDLDSDVNLAPLISFPMASFQRNDTVLSPSDRKSKKARVDETPPKQPPSQSLAAAFANAVGTAVNDAVTTPPNKAGSSSTATTSIASPATPMDEDGAASRGEQGPRRSLRNSPSKNGGDVAAETATTPRKSPRTAGKKRVRNEDEE